MSDDESIVVYRVRGREIDSYGRDTLATVEKFCRRPTWPAKLDDHFVGVDDWGHGTIVAATPSYSNWIGTSFAEFKRVAH